MRWLYVVPVVAFASLVVVLVVSLMEARSIPTDATPSALIDRPAPAFALPALDARTPSFAPRDLAAGHVTILNAWASWCVPCRAEAPALAALAERRDVVVYGLVYKDTPEKARGFLDEMGNPYQRIDLDRDGRAGIEWGLTGVPETFVIDGRGIVREHFSGPLLDSTLTNVILPAIARARRDG